MSLLGSMNPCVTCKKDMEPDNLVIQFNYCEEQEHVECVKRWTDLQKSSTKPW